MALEYPGDLWGCSYNRLGSYYLHNAQLLKGGFEMKKQWLVRNHLRWFKLGLPIAAGFALLFVCLWLASSHPLAVYADPIDPPAGYPKFITSVKVVSPALAHSGGQTLTYQIEIRNTGAYTGYDTVLVDTLPSEVSYNDDGWASAGSEPEFINGRLLWTGDVGFDSAVLISYTVTITDAFTGRLQNSAVISHPLSLESVLVTAETIVTDDPIFTIEKSVEPRLPGPGKVMTYTLLVGNMGQPAAGLPITITDRVPLSTTFENVGPDGDPGDGAVVTWRRDVSLATGEFTEFTFSVKVDDVISGTVITNDDYQVGSAAGSVTAGQPHTITITAPKLLLWKEIWPDPPGSNREMTYTLTLLNQGSLATGLLITDRVPVGVTYERGGSELDGVVSWHLPSLDTDDYAQVHFTVYITDVMDVPILNANYGACSAEGVCVSGRPITHVVQGPSFEVTAEVYPIAKKPGAGKGPVTPTLTIRNLGPGNALDVQAYLTFQNINVSDSDLLVFPNKGEFTPALDCGNQCFPYYWVGDLDVGEIITITTDGGQNSIGGSEGNFYGTAISVTDQLGPEVTDPAVATAGGKVTHLSYLIPTKHAPSEIGAGELLTYTINVWNSGLSTYEDEEWPGQILTDRVPISTTFVWASDGAITRTVSDTTTISWTLPHLGPGARVDRYFTVRTDEELVAGTEIYNDLYGTLWYQSDIKDFRSLPGEPVTTTIREVGLIDSFKTVSPTFHTIGAGHVFTYVLHVVNSGPHYLSDVSLYDYLPWQNSTYRRDAIASAGQLISDIVSLEWTGNLAPYTTQVLTMSVLVDPDYQGTLTNTAVISHADLRSPVIVNAVAYISDKPVLQIDKQVSAAIVTGGDELIYTIQVRNLGLRATQLQIIDQLPLNLSYVPNSADVNGTFMDGEVRWLIPLLEPNQSRSMTFRAIVNSGPSVVNSNYWVTSAEGVTTYGRPVITIVQGGRIYLPVMLR
jgi:uncharacterized repeat protein (TIGR01451 family)